MNPTYTRPCRPIEAPLYSSGDHVGHPILIGDMVSGIDLFTGNPVQAVVRGYGPFAHFWHVKDNQGLTHAGPDDAIVILERTNTGDLTEAKASTLTFVFYDGPHNRDLERL